MQVKTIIITLCVLMSINAFGIDDISLRLNPTFYDEQSQTVFVDVELRYQGQGQLNLADQNYRLYYDSDILSLKEDQSRSDLPQDLYSKLQFMEVYEDLNADGVNQLSFDDHLGFINFNIDLHSPAHAGIGIRKEDSWQRVAILSFNISDRDALSQIVWSKSGSTDNYATAFVEIMKWIAPNKTEPVGVNEYIDAAFNIEKELTGISLTVSPNPTTDFIKISFDQPLSADMDVLVYDGQGKKVKESTAYKNSEQLNLVVIDIAPGTYLVEFMPVGSTKVAHSTNFVKIDR